MTDTSRLMLSLINACGLVFIAPCAAAMLLARSKRRSMLAFGIAGLCLSWFGLAFLSFVPKSYAGIRYACRSCGSIVTDARVKMQGSLGVEIVLWLLFLLPGLIYSAWRFTTRGLTCSRCSARDLIPAETPEGRRIAAAANA